MSTGAEYKVVLITDLNKAYLQERFGAAEDTKPDLVTGYYLVAPFDSQDGDFDLLTPVELMRKFEATGEKLLNGFVEMRMR